ncbi:MFS transporter [Phenylobacterium montanum]|uniref:MFS transporter n=1 Tax=Phenylobacterium montanum TaxID=2823693 RepID=A0A975G2L2_9CAUL|nr:MFS transporter [Caulobacter sp. S6]QUD89983.1 MFS transporter [Caulobacter sp. S6]
MVWVLRLGLFFAALFVGSGASLPFIPVWFRAQGLTATQMAIILASPYFGRTLVGPLLGLWADLFRLRRTPMALMAAGSAVAYALLGLAHGFWAWLALWLVGTTLLQGLSPLGDVLGLRESRARGFAYAVPRGMGSAAYVIGNVGMGLVLARTAPVSVVIWAVAAAGLTALAAMFLLPPTPVHDGGHRLSARDLVGGLGELLRDPVFLLAIVAVGLIQSAHGFYYSFSTLLWRRQGLGAWTGLLWGCAVGAEVVFMWFCEPWRRRVGPERLVIIGGVGGLVRWIALSFSPPLWLLFPIQALHALSYTATFFGTLRLLERLSPPQSASAAQTLNSAVSGGILIGLTTIASGPLFDALGAHGYLVMAAIAGLGVALAVVLARITRLHRPGSG